ncbi:helix-turn-helix domain-containing protein [Maridesulfovibrio sp.]|uniref:helix-turn-helix domain-containing protein n=1 Tax=Maridesulfovibrio sp. TaxID=2795000 RepID=UPI0029CAAB9A|nr:helix-turn-helix domain-containing protein [Maridesulfovibrio sp.]
MSDLLEKIGSKIRTLRTANNLSQQKMAELAEISYKYLGEIERGQVNLSVEILIKISNALHVEASEILAMNSAEDTNISRAKFLLSELSEQDVKRAIDLLEALKKHSA